MHTGSIYNPSDREIMKRQEECFRLLSDYNSTKRDDFSLREEKLRKMFASFGKGSYIEIPFYANWAGAFAHIGEGVYANFNLTLVDDGEIFIGDHVMIGPNVTITTASHPLSPQLRQKGAQYNKSVRICNNVFIGAGATILPGVTIGEGSVVGAGSLVTKDIPSYVLAMGSPCRVVRPLKEEDERLYDHDKVIPSDVESLFS